MKHPCFPCLCLNPKTTCCVLFSAAGNYSDGNLVATLMCHRMGVTQCGIAHALEMTKYPDADIYWQKYEEKYHFGIQFTADLLAMVSDLI